LRMVGQNEKRSARTKMRTAAVTLLDMARHPVILIGTAAQSAWCFCP
jgi:hypothetical protein